MAIRESSPWKRRLRRLTTISAILFIAFGPHRAEPCHAGERPYRPATVELDPNPIQTPDNVMRIDVTGVPIGESVLLMVLQNCDERRGPDLSDNPACRSPLLQWQSPKAMAGRVVVERLDLRSHPELPRDRRLWLLATTASTPKETKPFNSREAMFIIASSSCSLWATIMSGFAFNTASGKESTSGALNCNLGLSLALTGHQGPARVPFTTFELRRMTPDRDCPVSVPLPDTIGATGFAWEDRNTLLVTRSRTPERPEHRGNPSPAVAATFKVEPGLYRVSLDGSSSLLWSTEGMSDTELVPAAPLPLPGGRVALAVHRISPGRDGEAGELLVLKRGRIKQRITVFRPLHRLLAADKRGRVLLALSLSGTDTSDLGQPGAGPTRPRLLEIDLDAGIITELGFNSAFYQELQQMPEGEDSVIAYEDMAGDHGWELALVDRSGAGRFALRLGPGDDLMPVWRPGGGDIVYLSEVERSGKKSCE